MPIVRNLYEKSILFEIVRRGYRSEPVEAFTLTLPPESIEIEEPQRVAETKTFGGLFIDDYGPDNMPIRISGNTGGSDVRRTYAPPSLAESVPEKLSGRKAFFHFRDRLMRYKDKLNNYADYDMIIYDLSTVPKIWLEAENPILEGWAEGYIVNLKNFKMTRNKDKPLWYNFSIELLGIRSLGTLVAEQKEIVSTPNPLGLVGNIQKGLNTIKTVFASIRNIKDQIEDVIGLVGDLSDQIISFTDQAAEIIAYPSSLAKLALGKIKDMASAIEDIEITWTETMGREKKEFYAILGMTRELESASAALVVYSKTPEATGRTAIRMTEEGSGFENIDTRFSGLTEDELKMPDNSIGQDVSTQSVVVIYGHINLKATATTTLEKLAAEYYRNPSWAELIAVYNGIEEDADIEIGQTIKIPVLLQGNVPTNNLIYSENIQDVYGSDILLDKNQNPVVGASGDYLTVEGVANVIQAMNLKLNEELGKRLRLTVYGIRSSVGGALTNSAPIAYIIANLKETLLQDPRITGVRNIKLRGVRDQLSVSLDTELIKIGDVVPFSGVM